MKARCPTCGEVHRADSLSALTKAVKACCGGRKRQPRQAQSVPKRQVELPELPYELRFDRQVLSQNRTTYSHWSVYKRDHLDWKSRAVIQLRGLAGAYLPYSEWSLTRLYCPPKREFDLANLVGGAKPLIDCLAELGVIVDDAPKYFRCTYRQFKSDRNQTVLTLLKVTDGTSPE